MSLCRVISYVVRNGYLLRPVCSLGNTFVSLCPGSFYIPRPSLPVTPGVSWLPTFEFQSSMIKRISFSWYYLYKFLYLFIDLFTLSFSTISGWVIDLHYCDIERFPLERNRVHSVILETASKYCILDSSVDYERYSISSKGFLLKVAGKSPAGAQECGEVEGGCCSGNRCQVPTSICSLCFWKLHIMQVLCPLWDTFSLWGITEQKNKWEAAPQTPENQGLELRLSHLDSREEEGKECLLQNKGRGITSELALGDGFMC